MLENGIMSSSKAQLVASSTALHEYRLQCGFICSNDDWRYCIKSHSTAWFNDFLMSVYGNDC
jgi:hypothetical protein